MAAISRKNNIFSFFVKKAWSQITSDKKTAYWTLKMVPKTKNFFGGQFSERGLILGWLFWER